MRIAVNGFGRIGRNFVRALLQDERARKSIELVAINIGPGDREAIPYIFKYDTLMGTFQGAVSLESHHTLHLDGVTVPLLAESSPEAINWKQYDVDWVVDCSGHFTHREDAEKHIAAGARAVLISAPAHGEDITIIPGVNTAAFNASKHKIVSLGSCTTNALMPMIKCLHDAFTIRQGFMTTVHAYTNSQVLLDVSVGGDVRRSRAAALNIIPTSTGAMKVLSKVMPELEGKMQGFALRVPVGKVSILDVVIQTGKTMKVEDIHNAVRAASKGAMDGIMDLSLEPLVSSDYSGNPHSVIIDGLLTEADGTMAKVVGWYDNEWAYSVRLKDFLLHCANR
jgi:glyceraldehyde 3-phosphate dehydrogenase